nr:hypothetical protein [Tanacetum cinerariifolium]
GAMEARRARRALGEGIGLAIVCGRDECSVEVWRCEPASDAEFGSP